MMCEPCAAAGNFVTDIREGTIELDDALTAAIADLHQSCSYPNGCTCQHKPPRRRVEPWVNSVSQP